VAAANQVHLDVREDIRRGQEPFARIMATVKALGPEQALVLRAPFEPVPLLAALGKRGRVEIATTGQWEGKELGLEGGPRAGANHAKIGVSLSGDRHYAIFGDMNQEGALSGNCSAAQNGRGGLFFVVDNQALYDSVTGLSPAERESRSFLARASKDAYAHAVLSIGRDRGRGRAGAGGFRSPRGAS